MNKTELIAEVAKKAGLTKVQAEAAVNAVVDSMTDALANGDKIQLFGFGTFEVKDLKARVGINPRTKEKMTCPPSKAPGFKPGKTLKEAVNK